MASLPCRQDSRSSISRNLTVSRCLLSPQEPQDRRNRNYDPGRMYHIIHPQKHPQKIHPIHPSAPCPTRLQLVPILLPILFHTPNRPHGRPRDRPRFDTLISRLRSTQVETPTAPDQLDPQVAVQTEQRRRRWWPLGKR